MTNNITIQRDLSVIALEIKSLDQQATNNSMWYAVEIGRRLSEAKEQVKHGEWGTWLKDNINYSSQTANNLMKIFSKYGAAQLGLFGTEMANSQTFGNLNYTKALALLAVPDEEREAFVEEHNVEEMSTRELQQAIKDRDEALRRAKELEVSAGVAATAADEQQKKSEELRMKLDEAQAALSAAGDKQINLEKQLKELESRPIDVAVQEPDQKVIDAAVKKAADEAAKKAKAEAEAAAKDKLEKAKAEKEKAEQKVKDLNAEIEKRVQDQAAKSAAELSAAQAEAEALRQKLKTADPDTAAFKVHFDAFQSEWKHMKVILDKLPTDRAGKFRDAMRTLIDQFAALLKE